jgi:hypothetical protein
MAGPLDLVLDAFVYVPVGLAVSARDVLPELAARGRERVASARVIGEFAVRQSQQQALRVIDRLQHPDGGAGPATDGPPSAPPPVRRAARSGPGADTLAIPGYDSLSASQVLPRLEGLEPGELEAVRVYEEAHRGRRTILGRISQLQQA